MAKVLFCDKCNKQPAEEDYDGAVLCKQHRAEKLLPYAQMDLDKCTEELELLELNWHRLKNNVTELQRVARGGNG